MSPYIRAFFRIENTFMRNVKTMITIPKKY